MSEENRLSSAEVGGRYTVERIEIGGESARRLEMLGMTRKTGIEVLAKKRRGPMIIRVRGTRFALGGGFADGIYVKRCGGEKR